MDHDRMDVEGKPKFRRVLTIRQQQILTYIAAGYQNKQIAPLLGISGQTIKNHCTYLYERLDVTNAASAVARAAHLGEIDLVHIEGIRVRRDLSKDGTNGTGR